MLDSLVATYANGEKFSVCVVCMDTMISQNDHPFDGWICDPCEEATIGPID